MIDTDTPYSDLADIDARDQLAATVDNEQTIRQLTGPAETHMTRQRAEMIAKLAARNIRADDTNTLTAARALNDAKQAEFNENGDPQRFPYDDRSSDAVRAAQALAADDHSDTAEHLREVAQSVRDHRAAYRAGHTLACRGDLYRGYCH